MKLLIVEIRPAEVPVARSERLTVCRALFEISRNVFTYGRQNLTVRSVSYPRIISVVRTAFGNEHAGLKTGGLLSVGGKDDFSLF